MEHGRRKTKKNLLSNRQWTKHAKLHRGFLKPNMQENNPSNQLRNNNICKHPTANKPPDKEKPYKNKQHHRKHALTVEANDFLI
jgi:hypothetical protein